MPRDEYGEFYALPDEPIHWYTTSNNANGNELTYVEMKNDFMTSWNSYEMKRSPCPGCVGCENVKQSGQCPEACEVKTKLKMREQEILKCLS